MEQGHGEVDGLPFVRMLGGSEVAGTGERLFTYTVYIERSIRIDRARFTHQIEDILADRRGWIRGGKVSFQRVARDAGTSLVLARPDTVDHLCIPLQTEGEVSCQVGSKVVINVKRWKRGVPHWPAALPLMSYRQMLVNHEMGHRMGQNHRYCPGDGKPAPVMQQQTYGLQGCRANSWPLDYELT